MIFRIRFLIAKLDFFLLRSARGENKPENGACLQTLNHLFLKLSVKK